jgi:hypothetical protein
MGKYVYVYYAGTASDGGSAEEWGKWFGELSDKLIDGGNPFAAGGQAVHKGGVMDVQGKPVTGYSIISAESMEQATELAKGCPLVATAEGAVCVYEALPM